MTRHHNTVRGSLTVEACIILPVVVITWLSLINLLNIYLIRSVFQQALSNTAARISEYYYMVERTFPDRSLESMKGLFKEEKTTSGTADALSTGLNNCQESVKKIGKDYDILMDNGTIDLATVKNMFEEGENFYKAAKDTANAIRSISAEGLKDYFLSQITNGVTGSVIGAFTDSYVKDLKVSEQNISNRTYANSEFFVGDDDEFVLVVDYIYTNPLSVKYAPYHEIHMRQMVFMRPWFGESGSGLKEAYQKSHH